VEVESETQVDAQDDGTGICGILAHKIDELAGFYERARDRAESACGVDLDGDGEVGRADDSGSGPGISAACAAAIDTMESYADEYGEAVQQFIDLGCAS